MRKLLCAVLAVLLAVGSAAFLSPVRAESGGAFQPRLDPGTECEITVVGSYSNFEALEAEFESFNEFYPDVELSYLKPDDYDNLLGTILGSSNAPNIFFSKPLMFGNDKYQDVVTIWKTSRIPRWAWTWAASVPAAELRCRRAAAAGAGFRQELRHAGQQ